MNNNGQKQKNEFDTGMGTSPGMWGMVSAALEGEQLPQSINNAIYALCEGKAFLVDQSSEGKSVTVAVIEKANLVDDRQMYGVELK